MKKPIILVLSVVSLLAAGYLLVGHDTLRREGGLRGGHEDSAAAPLSSKKQGESIDKDNHENVGTAAVGSDQLNSVDRTNSSPADAMLDAASGSEVSQAIAAKSVSSFCAPYYEHLSNNKVEISPKVEAWCSGIEKKISASQLVAMSNGGSTAISSVQQAVADLMSEKPSPDASSKALQLVRIANSPGDMASSADMLKRLEPELIFKGTALSVGDPRSGTITHFAGMAAWCSQGSCGSLSEATMLVCTWPGFTCSANDDFNTALARNFSPTDMEKIATVGHRLTEMRSGY
jgi:hypothetical protein